MRFLFLLPAPLFCFACTPLKQDGDRAPQPDAAQPVAAASDAPAPDAQACEHATPPLPPDPTRVAASHRLPDQAAPLDLVFAVSRTTFGVQATDAAPPPYPTIGFDLDNTCTGQGSCVEPSWATAIHHDGKNGIDNALGNLLISGGMPDPQDTTPGQTEILFRVSNYSGQPDDDQVEVSLYLGFGVALRDGGSMAPAWDGQDRWTILPEALVQPTDSSAPNVDQPRYRAYQAYVNGGVLVARFKETLWPAGVAAVPRLLIHARELEIDGNLMRPADAGTPWALQHVVAGMRFATSDNLTSAAFQPNTLLDLDAGPLEFICKDPASYQWVKQMVICPYVDITLDPMAPASSPCDAISGGMLFDVEPALLGDVAAPAPESPQCDPSVHPETDNCDSLADQ